MSTSPFGPAAASPAAPGISAPVAARSAVEPPRRAGAGWFAQLALLAPALLGWWLSFDLLRISAGGAATNPLIAAQCDARGRSATGDAGGATASPCLVVLTSEFAFVGAPEKPAAQRGGRFPWAALGLAYFSMIVIWIGLLGAPARRTSWQHLPLYVLLLFGAGISVDLVHTLAFVLQRWCGGCVLAHAMNGLLLLGVILSLIFRSGPTVLPARAHVLATLFATLLGGYLPIAVTQSAMERAGYARVQAAYAEIVSDPAFIRWRYERQPIVDLPTPPDALAQGPENAPHTLVAFVDFQCPACKQACDQIAAVRKNRPHELRVIYRHFPQDRACNPTFRGPGHPAACEAARAVLAAFAAGGIESAARLTTALYENQSQLDTRRFVDWAAEVGLDRGAFELALKDSAVATRLASDIELGARLGLSAMPALFLNGRRLEHWQRAESWDALLAPSALGEPRPHPEPRP